MYIFFKHTFISIVLTMSLYSHSDSKNIINFIQHKFIKNPMIKIMDVDILETSFLREPRGWEVYFLNITLKAPVKGSKISKEVIIPQILFTDGNFISPSLINIKTGKALEKTMYLPLKESIYDNKHLIAGNKNAKHKIVVFSDPQCYYCKKLSPELIEVSRKHPDKIALYSYHFPLTNIHPVSTDIAKIMIMEHKAGNIDNIIKLYSLEIDPKETNTDKILAKIKKDLGLRYKKSRFLTKEIEQELEHDKKVSTDSMISSTPTVYIDGELDMTRVKYKELLK